MSSQPIPTEVSLALSGSAPETETVQPSAVSREEAQIALEGGLGLHRFFDGSLSLGVLFSLVLHASVLVVLYTSGVFEGPATYDEPPDEGEWAEAVAYADPEPEEILPEPEVEEPIDEPEPIAEPDLPDPEIEEPVQEPPEPEVETAAVEEEPAPAVEKAPEEPPAEKIAEPEAPPKLQEDDRLRLPDDAVADENTPLIPAGPQATRSTFAAPATPSYGTRDGDPNTKPAAQPVVTPAKNSVDTQGLTRGYLRSVNSLVKKQTRYPRQARRAGAEGKVIVMVVLDPKGRVLSVEVHKSSGHSILDRAALETIRSITSFPAPPQELEWDPAGRKVLIPVRFKLND